MSINACGQPTGPESTGSPGFGEQYPTQPGQHSRVGPGYIGPDGTWPMPPGEGPCRTWPLEPNCGCLSPFAEAWDANKIHAVEVATEILWRKTAGKYGLCQETVRPCRQPCAEPAPRGGVAWPDPNGTAPIPGSWGGAGHGRFLEVPCGGACGSGGRSCGCGPTSDVVLPGPVYWESPGYTGPPVPEDEDPWGPRDPLKPGQRYRITVWIDGVEQHGNYWLHNGNTLVRTDGGQWPVCQDLTKPPAQDRWIEIDSDGNEISCISNHDTSNTFAIQYWRGIPVPPGGRRAVSILACELYKACIGDDSCRLPRGVTEIQREGISYTLMDQQQDMLANLPDVSGWVASVNPRQMYERSTVWSPDMPRMRSDWTSGGRPNPPYTYRRDPWGWR